MMTATRRLSFCLVAIAWGVTAARLASAGTPAKDQAAIVDGHNQLALELLQQLVKEWPQGNIVLSPLSATSALVMAYAGSRGETARQLANALHTDLPPDRLPAAWGAITATLTENAKDTGFKIPEVGLRVVNGLFVDRSVPVEAGFRQMLATDMNGDVVPATFRSPEAASSINKWVAKHTSGRIRSALSPADVTRAGFVLVNTVLLTALWDPFEQAKPGSFHVDSEHTVQVPMLRDDDHARGFADTATFTLAEQEFLTGKTAVDVALPKLDAGASVEAVIASLSAGVLNESIRQLKEEHATFAMPKFTTSRRLDLAAAFEHLGLTLPFAPGADFSALSTAPLFVATLEHVVAMEVDETGVRAAAASFGIGSLGESVGPIRRDFIVDRPYLLIVRDRPTGALLLMAVIRNPLLKN